MPFVPSSQRLATSNNTQIQVTEAINPTPSKQMMNEDPETNNSQPNYENENNNNDLEDLLLTVLDELDVVKNFAFRKRHCSATANSETIAKIRNRNTQ